MATVVVPLEVITQNQMFKMMMMCKPEIKQVIETWHPIPIQAFLGFYMQHGKKVMLQQIRPGVFRFENGPLIHTTHTPAIEATLWDIVENGALIRIEFEDGDVISRQTMIKNHENFKKAEWMNLFTQLPSA